MSYPTPMDVAESEDREAMTDPFADELAKCSVLYTENLVAEREALIAELAECTEKRERYALQVCLLLDAMREAGVHIDEKWCWCQPTIENNAEDGFTVSVLTGPRPYQKPEMMGTITCLEQRTVDAKACIEEIVRLGDLLAMRPGVTKQEIAEYLNPAFEMARDTLRKINTPK